MFLFIGQEKCFGISMIVCAYCLLFFQRNTSFFTLFIAKGWGKLVWTNVLAKVVVVLYLGMQRFGVERRKEPPNSEPEGITPAIFKISKIKLI